MTQIVPKSKAPGDDFFGLNDHYFIVRSDVGCFMRAPNFSKGNNLEVNRLHNSCWGADHYLACEEAGFYVIKGDNYRFNTDISTDAFAAVYSLHPNCRGGDHYVSAFKEFYIIYQGKGIYRRVTNMHTDEGAVEYTLHPECKNGLYYWGGRDCFYFVKRQDEWGIQYYRCTNLHENTGGVTYSFHRSVVPFIPGGLAVNEGAAFSRWEAIKTISNDSDNPIEWNKKITKKVGYNKKRMNSVEHNWKINVSASLEPGVLTEAIAKIQFSLSAEYGGKAVQTQEQDWSEATGVEESIRFTLKPHSEMYVWQYQLGFGDEPVLFCRDMKVTNDSTRPTNIPLPPAKP